VTETKRDRGAPHRAKARRALESGKTASRGVAGVPVTGCLARGEALVGPPVRKAYKPRAAWKLAPSSRLDEERKPMRVGPPGNRRAHHRPGPREGRSELRGWRESATERPTRKRAVRLRAARSAAATPRREAWELVNGSRAASSRSSGPRPLRGRGPPRAGRRGVPPQGGTGKTLRSNARKGEGGAGGWRTGAL